MLTTEQIHEICKLQHKITVCEILISKMPLGYTNADIAALERDMNIRSMHESCTRALNEIITSVGMEAIGATFGDKEIMTKPENRFTFEEQRQATKEVIGKELTLEEVLEYYGISGE